METGFYAGRRLSYGSHLCTVRYHGSLAGTTGQWLGVEWDDTSRGKHSGQHKDEQIFQCRSSSSTAASFVRPTRKPDQEQSVLEAIKSKYGSGSVNDASDASIVIISGKVAEEVGFDKIAREQAQLSDLRVVLIDKLVVNAVSPRGSASEVVKVAQRELYMTCPNITELDLGWNTIESWRQIADICAALPKLRILKTGGLRLTAYSFSGRPNCFDQIRELHLEGCLLTTDNICDLLSQPSTLPRLEDLYLSSNRLTNLVPSENTGLPQVKGLKNIVLENNDFKDLGCVAYISKMFPNITSISLQANQITEVGKLLDTSSQSYPQISALNLAYNSIETYAFIDTLPRIFPNLSSLRITNNPLFTQAGIGAHGDARASDKSFYLTLARLPGLKILNYSNITARDRHEGEIYYLSIAEAELKAQLFPSRDRKDLVSDVDKVHPRYLPLSKKYDRETVVDRILGLRANGDQALKASTADITVYSPGSLGARLVTATFYMASQDQPQPMPVETTLRLPSTLPATRLMAILLHHAAFQDRLEPLQFKLIYESRELDPVDTTTESTTRSAVYAKNLTADEKKTLWREWGDWDADALLEEARQKHADPHPSTSSANDEHWTDDGRFCMKEGRRWKRREIEIPHALKRPWGDWIEQEKEVRIRIEPLSGSSQDS